MIKFFRKIRKKLLSENKFSKYLIYAIGEIVLVVIGILIALQINNWNEQNKIDKIENTYLTRLSQDLEENITSWENLIKNEEKRFEGTKQFIKFSLNKNKDSVLTIFPYFNIVGRWDDLTVNQVTFEEMKSSGSLDIISNDSIKIRLLQLDQYYKKVFERNATIKTGHDKNINDPIFDNLNALNLIVLDNTFSDLHSKTYTSEELEAYLELIRSDLFKLINNQKFMNSMVASMYSHELVLGEIQDAYANAQKLKQLIDSELEK
ncbi:MAG: DUF6090 family protein [Bacteroidetes bacterium]|nr:DUF6090 family protein [Bacteroidota bacterium]